MMKKVLSFVLTVVMVMSMSVTAFAAGNDVKIQKFESTIIDKNGEELTSVVQETKDSYIIEIYCDGTLDHRVTTDKQTGKAILDTYRNDKKVSRQNYDLKEHLKAIALDMETENFVPSIEPLAELFPTKEFNIVKSYRTDYVYNGKILYGNTKTMASELSSSNRYEGHMLQFSKGTAVGLVVSALLAAYGGAITVTVLAELGIPVAAGVLVDTISQKVCFTKYRVVTKVWFDNIHTVYAGKTYDKVLVTAAAGGGVHYSTGYYGYDIIDSWASTCCSSGAVAFSDKYITGHNKNLQLPVTSIPYNG